MTIEQKMDETLNLVRALSEHVLREDPQTGALGKRRSAAARCTQHEFARLPALVGRGQFLAWTGLSDRELTEAVRAGSIAVYRPCKTGYAMYYKHEIARLGKFVM